jgi:hypothetical protein
MTSRCAPSGSPRRSSSAAPTSSASRRSRYVARIPLTIAGRSLAFVRGYDALELRAGGQRLRFVDTHLESASSDVAYAQAQELLAGPAAPSGEPEIVV